MILGFVDSYLGSCFLRGSIRGVFSLIEGLERFRPSRSWISKDRQITYDGSKGLVS